MPRSPQGLYTLPPGNPVTPGTLIESAWANNTMNDVADALTQSLPRNGSAPMTGPLTLNGDTPTSPHQAVDKSYVDNFVAYSTGLPIGFVIPYAGSVVPGGFLLCNGQAVSRTTYDQLFTAIGTTYGVGDGSTTFNLPNLVDRFIRGKSSTRALGSIQQSSLASHNHSISDPGHTHVITPTAHSHADGGHYHAVSDPGHAHGYNQATITVNAAGGPDSFPFRANAGANTNAALTGISLAIGYANIGASYAYSNASSSVTGVAIGSTGGTETVPINMALNYYIKAVHDSTQTGNVVNGITSSDTSVITVDASDPANPIIVPHTNVALGMVKLDSNNKIPVGLLPTDTTHVTSVTSGNLSTLSVDNTDPQTPIITPVVNQANALVQLDANNLIPVAYIPTGTQTFLGPFSCAGGQNPSEKYPTETFTNGMTYLVVEAGTITVYDPITYTAAPTLVNLNNSLVWLDTAGHPVGWYNIASTAQAVTASGVTISPIAGITSTNVQGALEEINTAADAVQTATETPITTIPNLAASNVQAALAEIETQVSSIFSGFKNKLINGNFDVWQRGTTFLQNAKYGSDRWGHSDNNGSVFSRVAANLDGANYALQVGADATTATRLQVGQALPNEDSVCLRGKTLTLSFWVKFSGATIAGAGNFVASLGEKTTTADAAYSTSNYLDASSTTTITNGSLPTVWTRYTVTRVISAGCNNLNIDFRFQNAITGSSYYQLSQVQVEEGSVATEFEILPVTMVMNECLRFYETQSSTRDRTVMAIGMATSATLASFAVNYHPKRVVPSMVLTGTMVLFNGTGGFAATIGGWITGLSSGDLIINSSSLVAGQVVLLRASTNVLATLQYNSEL